MTKRKTISVLSIKGGTGKTVTTLHLAGMLANEGNSVLVIDSDSQGSAFDLHSSPERGEPLFDLRKAKASEILDVLNEEKERDFIFVDFPRFTDSTDSAYFSALALMDKILVPVKGTTVDLRSAVRFISILQAIPGTDFAVFLSMEERTNDFKIAKEILWESGAYVFEEGVPKLKVLDDPDVSIAINQVTDRFNPFYQNFKQWVSTRPTLTKPSAK